MCLLKLLKYLPYNVTLTVGNETVVAIFVKMLLWEF